MVLNLKNEFKTEKRFMTQKTIFLSKKHIY